LTQDGGLNIWIRNAVEDAINGIRPAWLEDETKARQSGGMSGYQFLVTKKPLFATGSKEALTLRLERIAAAAEILRKREKGFIGIVVNGSTEKGYMLPTSDLDIALVGHNIGQQLFKGLEEFLKASVCAHGSRLLEVDEDEVARGDVQEISVISSLFQGLFFGDRETLARVQQKTFSELDHETWDRLRGQMFVTQANIEKAVGRLDIKDKSLETFKKAKRIAVLNRVPPPYEETKKILERRMRKMEEKKKRENDNNTVEIK
jgi:hypothetical protein